jgi:hypothetical protein
MRNICLTLLLAVLTFMASAQKNQKMGNNEIQTILPKGKGFGAYGALSMGYTQLDSKDAFVTGARGGIILGQSLGLGVAGYGFLNDVNYHHFFDAYPMRQSLAGGYGGVFIEPIIGSNKAIHLAFPVLFGAGGLALLEYGGWRGMDYIYERDYDPFLVLEPAAELEFNFTRFLRVAAYVSYRFTTRIDLQNVDENVLRGPTIGAVVKLGKF